MSTEPQQLPPPAPLMSHLDGRPAPAADRQGQQLLRGLWVFLLGIVIVIMFVGDLKSLLGW